MDIFQLYGILVKNDLYVSVNVFRLDVSINPGSEEIIIPRGILDESSLSRQ